MLLTHLIRKASDMIRLKPLLLSSFLSIIVLGLGACGGGGGGGSSTNTPTFSGPDSVLYSFGSTKQSYFDGAYPGYGHLILASDGNLYGVTSNGGNLGEGAVIKIVPGSGQTSVVWSFGGTDSSGNPDGATPVGSLIQYNGNFYGMTRVGGVNTMGTVFELTVNGTSVTEKVLSSFGGTGNGIQPYGSLIQYNGNFYGMTYGGGANGYGTVSNGTVFELTPGTTPTETVLWSFGGSGDGASPYGSLIQYNGNFYGMTSSGGANGKGTVFELIPGTTPSETVLWSFGGTGDGVNPQGSLIQYNGNFYGMTPGGGANGNGTVFELTPGTTPTETVLWSFGGSGDGASPYGSLIQYNGSFYGMTKVGGASVWGTVFELTPGTTPSETVLWSFGGGTGDGIYPTGSLVQDSGNLYGMTTIGGANSQGVAFSLNPTTQQETVLHSFTGGGGDANSPNGSSLIQDSQGNFFGMTQNGGINNRGTVFELTSTGTETVLWSFGGTDSAGNRDGYQPSGSLIQDSHGNFYGMTLYGGANAAGTVFELTPGTTPIEKVLWSFGRTDSVGNTDGNQPSGSLIQDSHGNFYGVTYSGGANGNGTVFELTLGTTPSETVLWSFGGTDSAGNTDGSGPEGSLIQDSQGSFYGTTNGGGANSGGTVFELTLGTTPTEKVLWSFGGADSIGNKDGTGPQGHLIQDSQGNFYGVTYSGGAYGSTSRIIKGSNGGGTIFELTPGTTPTEKVL